MTTDTPLSNAELLDGITQILNILELIGRRLPENIPQTLAHRLGTATGHLLYVREILDGSAIH
jgi:hypothetical protein